MTTGRAIAIATSPGQGRALGGIRCWLGPLPRVWHNLGLCQIGAADPAQRYFGQGISTWRLQGASARPAGRRSRLRLHGEVGRRHRDRPRAAEVMAAIADVLAGCAYLRRRAGQLSVSVLVAAAGKSMRALGGPRSSPGSRHRCQLASLSSRAAETGG
jgi:hypothetical protein